VLRDIGGPPELRAALRPGDLNTMRRTFADALLAADPKDSRAQRLLSGPVVTSAVNTAGVEYNLALALRYVSFALLLLALKRCIVADRDELASVRLARGLCPRCTYPVPEAATRRCPECGAPIPSWA